MGEISLDLTKVRGKEASILYDVVDFSRIMKDGNVKWEVNLRIYTYDETGPKN